MKLQMVDDYNNFNSNYQYGDAKQYRCLIDKRLFVEMYDVFKEQIKENIPPKYRERIRWIVKQPDFSDGDPVSNYGVIGWRYDPPTVEINKNSDFCDNINKFLDIIVD